MANRLSGKGGSGGGLGSKNVNRVGVRTGATREGIRERGVSQIGSSLGNHSTASTASGKILRKAVEPVRGGPMPAGGNVPLGNQVSAETNCGPGGSRTVMPSGGQGTR
jgi:hypothetical protein